MLRRHLNLSCVLRKKWLQKGRNRPGKRNNFTKLQHFCAQFFVVFMFFTQNVREQFPKWYVEHIRQSKYSLNMKSSLSSKHSDLVGKCVMYCVFLVLIYEILLGQIRFARKIPNCKQDKPRNGVITISHLKEAQNKTNSIIALFCAHFTTRKLQSSFEKAMKK